MQAAMDELLSRLAGIGARPFAQRAKRSDRPVGLVLMHHGVAEVQGGPDELLPALGVDMFRAQLEHLSGRYEVVPLRELSARVSDRSPGQRLPVAITFDDDLSCHTEIVAPILESFGFHATFFLTGSTLNGPSSFWWQDMQMIRNRGESAWNEMRQRLAEDWPWAGLDSPTADLTLAVENLPADERDSVSTRLRELAGPEPLDPGLDAAGVKELVGHGFGVEFHTRRHYCLPTLNPGELDRAMREGVDELENVIGYRPTAIAYPHAKADLRIAAAAQQAGFDLGVVCRHAATTERQHPLLIDRVSALTTSLGSFALALARLSAA